MEYIISQSDETDHDKICQAHSTLRFDDLGFDISCLEFRILLSDDFKLDSTWSVPATSPSVDVLPLSRIMQSNTPSSSVPVLTQTNHELSLLVAQVPMLVLLIQIPSSLLMSQDLEDLQVILRFSELVVLHDFVCQISKVPIIPILVLLSIILPEQEFSS
jgi:hypothetical protein